VNRGCLSEPESQAAGSKPLCFEVVMQTPGRPRQGQLTGPRVHPKASKSEPLPLAQVHGMNSDCLSKLESLAATAFQCWFKAVVRQVVVQTPREPMQAGKIYMFGGS
jgi:hypothetical protein